MNDDGGGIFVMGGFFGFLIGCFMAWICWSADITKLKDDAVSKNHAEYFFDSKFEKQWRWKE